MSVESLQGRRRKLCAENNLLVQIQGGKLIQSKPIHNGISMAMAKALLSDSLGRGHRLETPGLCGTSSSPKRSRFSHVDEEHITKIIRACCIDFLPIFDEEVWSEGGATLVAIATHGSHSSGTLPTQTIHHCWNIMPCGERAVATMTRLNMSLVYILGQHSSTTKDILLGVWQGLGSAALVESEVGIAEHDGQGRQGDLNNSCIIKRLDKAFAYDQGKEVHVVFIVYDILSIWHKGQRMKTQLKAQGLKKRLAEGN